MLSLSYFFFLFIFMLRTWKSRRWLMLLPAAWARARPFFLFFSLFLFISNFLCVFFSLSMSSLRKWLLNKVQVMCVQNVIVREIAVHTFCSFFRRSAIFTSYINIQDGCWMIIFRSGVEKLYLPIWWSLLLFLSHCNRTWSGKFYKYFIFINYIAISCFTFGSCFFFSVQ